MSKQFSWVDDAFLQHLLGRQNQSGVTRQQIADSIMARLEKMRQPSLLAQTLEQRWQPTQLGPGNQLPFVYAQPVPAESTPQATWGSAKVVSRPVTTAKAVPARLGNPQNEAVAAAQTGKKRPEQTAVSPTHQPLPVVIGTKAAATATAVKQSGKIDQPPTAGPSPLPLPVGAGADAPTNEGRASKLARARQAGRTRLQSAVSPTPPPTPTAVSPPPPLPVVTRADALPAPTGASGPTRARQVSQTEQPSAAVLPAPSPHPTAVSPPLPLPVVRGGEGPQQPARGQAARPTAASAPSTLPASAAAAASAASASSTSATLPRVRLQAKMPPPTKGVPAVLPSSPMARPQGAGSPTHLPPMPAASGAVFPRFQRELPLPAAGRPSAPTMAAGVSGGAALAPTPPLSGGAAPTSNVIQRSAEAAADEGEGETAETAAAPDIEAIVAEVHWRLQRQLIIEAERRGTQLCL